MKFAANLSMMFTEVEFPERFQQAADQGFRAVEYLFPYEWSSDLQAAKLNESNLIRPTPGPAKIVTPPR